MDDAEIIHRLPPPFEKGGSKEATAQIRVEAQARAGSLREVITR